MATNNVVTYGSAVKVSITNEDGDLMVEWALDGGMTAYQSFNVKTKSGQGVIRRMCGAVKLLQLKDLNDIIGKRCRLFVSSYTPCAHSNTFFFVIDFDI